MTPPDARLDLDDRLWYHDEDAPLVNPGFVPVVDGDGEMRWFTKAEWKQMPTPAQRMSKLLAFAKYAVTLLDDARLQVVELASKQHGADHQADAVPRYVLAVHQTAEELGLYQEEPAVNSLLWAALLSALVAVERPTTPQAAEAAIAREGAHGVLQIRQPCLDDVNRIYRNDIQRSFGRPITLQDCAASESVSRWVCVRYLTHYGKAYEKETGKAPTFETLARIFNGGPTGWKKKSTEGYWQRVKEQLDNSSSPPL